MAPEVDISYMIEQLVNNDPVFYSNIRNDLVAQSQLWGFSLQHVESVKSMQDNLNALALIATFMAAVQAQVITYSIQSHSTKLQVAINALFFTGLFLDILGGCVAYMIAIQLQHIYALLLRRTTSISRITDVLEQYTPPPGADSSKPKAVANLPSLCIHLRFIEVIFLHAMSKPSAWASALSKMQETQQCLSEIIRLLDKRLHARAYIHLGEYQRTTDELDKSRAGVSIATYAIATLRTIVLIGVACCIVGGLCYVKDALPAGVWITSFTVVGGILIFFMVMVGQTFSRS